MWLGISLARSACVICPYRSDEHWLELKRSEPASYDEAVEFDRWLRRSKKTPVRKLLNGRPYLHAARRPLSSIIEERELEGANAINNFSNSFITEQLCSVRPPLLGLTATPGRSANLTEDDYRLAGMFNHNWTD